MFNWAFKKIVKLREKVAVDLGGEDVEKPFLDHLEDLRSMIVRMCITLVVVTLLTFFFCKDLVTLIEYPLAIAGLQEKILLPNFKPTGAFMTAMNVSLMAGVILAFPVLLYFLLQFILPGLKNNEKKVIFPALGVGGGLFLIGVVFAYFVVAPRALQFFYEFGVDLSTTTASQSAPGPQQMLANGFGILWENKSPDLKQTIEGSMDGKTWTPLGATPAAGTPAAGTPAVGKEGEAASFHFVRIVSAPVAGAPAGTPPPEGATVMGAPRPIIWELTEYVKFVCQFVLIFGACFELPVVVMALVKMDVLNYKVMKGTRAWAAVIIAIVAAVITPTQDALTLALLGVPMYALYEICIWLAWWMEKKDRKLYPEYYKDRDQDEKALEVSDDWDNESYNPLGQDDDEEDESSSKPAISHEDAPPPAEASTPAETPPSAEAPPHDEAHPGTDAKPSEDKPDEENRNMD